MDDTTRLLVRARRRLADPRRWTTGASARDAAGRAVPPVDAGATTWCAMGALQAEGDARLGDRGFLRALRRLNGAIASPGCDQVSLLNDTLGHAAVLDLYDRAIRGK